jgi:hypothetical protein
MLAGHLTTRPGARTSLFVPSLDRLYVAARAGVMGSDAACWSIAQNLELREVVASGAQVVRVGMHAPGTGSRSTLQADHPSITDSAIRPVG